METYITGSVALLLVYQTRDGHPLTLARVDSPELFLQAAEHVLGKAELRVEALSDVDQVLGSVERQEVERLRRVLRIVAPELGLRTIEKNRRDPVM